MIIIDDSVIARFWAKVSIGKPDECWLWSASTSTLGYGQMKVAGRVERAHRIGYQIQVGEIPEGRSVLHRCDNRLCVNGKHLYVGTHDDNMEDMRSRGRGRGGLTWDDARQIRKLLASGYKQMEVARMVGTSQTTVSLIKRNKIWKDTP